MTSADYAKALNEANQFLDEEFHQAAAELGKEFLSAAGHGKDGKTSTQIRNLQQIVASAARFADIEDFVKNQMGKEKRDKQGKLGLWRMVGPTVLEQLGRLRGRTQKLSSTDEGDRLRLRLHLARGWVRAVVGGYQYAKAVREMGTQDV